MTRLWSSSVSRPEAFQHALDDEHHVGAAGVVLVEAQRDVVLVRPGQDAVTEFGDLLAFLDDDGVLADQVDTADVAVEVDAHARPVEPRRDLLDVGRLAGAVVAGHDDAAVVGEAGQDRQGGRAVEAIVRIDVRHVFVRLRVGGNLHVALDAEKLPDRHLHVGHGRGGFSCGCHCYSVAPERRGAAISCRDSFRNGAKLAEAIALRKPPCAWLKCRNSGPIVEQSRVGLCCAKATHRPSRAPPGGVHDRRAAQAPRRHPPGFRPGPAHPVLRGAPSGAEHRRHEDDGRLLRRACWACGWSMP